MRKTGLTAFLLAAALFTGFGVTTAGAEGMKCGAGKCGSSMKKMNMTDAKSCNKPDCQCGADCQCGDNCKCGNMKKITMDGGKAMSGGSCEKPGCKCGPNCQCGENCKCGDIKADSKKCGANK